MTCEELGVWAEHKAGMLLHQMGGRCFKNFNEYDPTDDLYLVVGTSTKLQGLGLRDGPLQVKGKKTSTYRYKGWGCEESGKSGEPREEHGFEYDRHLRYVRRGIQAYVFVEVERETEPQVFCESGDILLCFPANCDPRVGGWTRIRETIFFDRASMIRLGNVADVRETTS